MECGKWLDEIDFRVRHVQYDRRQVVGVATHVPLCNYKDRSSSPFGSETVRIADITAASRLDEAIAQCCFVFGGSNKAGLSPEVIQAINLAETNGATCHYGCKDVKLLDKK